MKYKLAIILLSIIAISGISITAVASATPVTSSNIFNNSTMQKISLQQTYVRVDGSVKAWGMTSAVAQATHLG